MINVIIIAVICVLVVFSIRHIYRQRRQGGCGCGCSGCSSAATCHPSTEQNPKKENENTYSDKK